ncbi:hypothetical protein D3Z38_19020, partial [Clostridiales bacterium]|nr:hypothetical protein [Clostridiales bacterium]
RQTDQGLRRKLSKLQQLLAKKGYDLEITEDTVTVCTGYENDNYMEDSGGYSYGIGRYTADDGTVTWDCVWFGHYPQSSDGNGGFNNDPIKWRVLSADGDEALLLADQNLDCKRYNETYTDVTWETSTVRSWLNGYGSGSNKEGKDYTNDNFMVKAFTAAERGDIKEKTIEDPDNPYYNTEGGNDTRDTRDKIFSLSIDEVTKPAYGFPSDYSECSKTRRALNTDYAKSQAALADTSTEYAGNGWWWLRLPGGNSRCAACVDSSGYVSCGGYYISDDRLAVRPALFLNLKSNLWSSTVSDSKVKGPKKVALKKISFTKKGILKLTWKRYKKATGYQAIVATKQKKPK